MDPRNPAPATGDDSGARQSLSALMDGTLGAADTEAACRLWRHSAQARDDWHAYHLIGDVLRSDDLASTPTRDEAFLQALRGRLAQEPVPMAPAALVTGQPEVAAPRQVANGAPVAGFVAAAPVSSRRARYRLVGPAAMVAGFVAVAGVFGVLREGGLWPSADPASGNVAASGGAGVATLPVASTGAGQGIDASVTNASVPGAPVASGGAQLQLVRDPVLDRYLSAHRSLAHGALPVSNVPYRVISNERP